MFPEHCPCFVAACSILLQPAITFATGCPYFAAHCPFCCWMPLFCCNLPLLLLHFALI